MTEAWAYIDADGRILADSTFVSAEAAWNIALGWPTNGEVEHAKANGCRVVRVRIEEIGVGKFKRGDFVRKKSGSAWAGLVVGEYSTAVTPEGYAVESSHHPGSVQIYPAAALELLESPIVNPGSGE